MMIKSLWSCCLAFLFAIVASTAVADTETVRIAVNSSTPPYVDAHSNSGLEVDIIREAFSSRGRAVKFFYFKGAGGLNNFSAARVDAVVVHKAQNVIVPHEIYRSHAFIEYKNYAISLKEKRLAIDRVEDLESLKTVAFLGAREKLGDAYAGAVAKNSHYREVGDQSNQVSALYRGVAEVVVADKHIFEHYLSKGSFGFRGGELEYHDLFASSPRCMVFLDEATRDLFDEGLKAIKSSGQYAAIYERYKLPVRGQ